MSSVAQAQARKSPDFLKASIVYQIFLRAFTPEGTLGAASKMLPHLASLGVDLVYLTPIALQDDDMDEAFWSPRQCKSGLRNPKNPYRVKDYFAIDPEYGCDADLKDFVGKAHELGMRVLLDLVYLHCGPKAVFLDGNADFVKRDAAGKPVPGRWNFPELNFESKGLRELLWLNMEYFVKEFGVDGYRCDVGAAIPVDFWEEGRRRVEALDPDCVMICEGDRPEDQLSAFDLSYAFAWEYGVIKLFKGEIGAADLEGIWRKMHDEFPKGSRFLRILDNHDIAHDCGELRHEKAFGGDGVEAALALNFFMDGVPFIYNGQEAADAAVHSIYGNREFGRRLAVDWSNALTPAGEARLKALKSFVKIRRENAALTEGDLRWLSFEGAPAKAVAFARGFQGREVVFAVNAGSEPLRAVLSEPLGVSYPKTLLERGARLEFKDGKAVFDFLPRGYIALAL